MPRLSAEALEPRDVPAAGFDSLPILPGGDPGVIDSARAIVARGQTLGRSPDAFMKVGDSNSDVGYGAGYLFPFGGAGFDAGPLAARNPELLDALAAYRTPAGASGSNSFGRVSPVAVAGARATSILDGLAGEASTTQASVALVMIGTNDVYVRRGTDGFRTDLRELVRRLTAAGVVPVLSTIPDNVAFGGALAADVPGYNQVIADVAAEYRLPLLNLWRAYAALPSRGLGSDGLHLSASPTPGGVSPADLQFGQNLRSLLSLQALDWFREQVLFATPDVPAATAWTALAPGAAIAAVGRGEGQPPVVSVVDAAGREVNRFLAFAGGFTGGVRATTADVTGDGVPDVVVGAGLGGGPVVKVFSGADGAEVASWFAFEPAFRSGVTVAAADLDGDGVAEVVVGAGDGGGPVVAVYHGGDLRETARYFAYEPSFRGGVNVAAGELPGIGPAVVAGAGVGGGPVVKVFDANGALVRSYFAYDPAVRGGVRVAVADGLVASVPASGVGHVRLIDAAALAERASFLAPAGVGFGARLGVLRDESGADALLIGNGAGAAVGVWAYRNGSAAPFAAADPLRAYGVELGS